MMKLGEIVRRAFRTSLSDRAWLCALCHSTAEIVELSQRTRDPRRRRVLALAAALWGDHAEALQMAHD